MILRTGITLHVTPLSFDVSFLENPYKYSHKPYIARVPELHMTAAIVRVYLYLILRKCFRKPRKDVLDEC